MPGSQTHDLQARRVPMSTAAQAIFEWFSRCSLPVWIAFSLAGNVAIFLFSVGLCGLLGLLFRDRPLFDRPQTVTRGDLWLAGTAVVLNSAVAVVGWLLWKAGWIQITHPAWWRTLLDLLVFVGTMDLGMYLSHRLAHHPWLYARVHARHHTHESVNPISLFVLHPFEVLGFGGLMITVLVLLPLSGIAVLAYLTLNVLFGTLGHAGVEPFPAAWSRLPLLRDVGSSSFHAAHHRAPGTNFGFYTTVWDRLFGTRDEAGAF